MVCGNVNCVIGIALQENVENSYQNLHTFHQPKTRSASRLKTRSSIKFSSLQYSLKPHIQLHTHPFNGAFSGTTQVSRYQKGKPNLDFTDARDSEWQWHQLGHMQICTLFQTDNHVSTPPLSFLQAGCPSCHPANSVRALKANTHISK